MILDGSVFSKPWPSHVPMHVAAPNSTNSKRLTTEPAGEGFDRVCECTEPAGTNIGAVSVGRGGQTWPKQMLNLTHEEKNYKHGTLLSHDSLRRGCFLL